MPTITLNKTVFESLVGKKLPLNKLKDRISYLGTDLESIEGNEITVEIFPNRPDLLSEQGFARAFSSFIGVKTGLKEYKAARSNEKVKIERSVSEIRPYTTCAIVKGLNFDDEKIKEIIQIQEKLHITYGRNRKKVAIGVYPYEKIKPPIRFLAKDPKEIKFRPLEFPKEITGMQILSQHTAGREYGHLLEGKEKFPIFVDSNDKILSMPPIINSHEVGKIMEDTKEVFIECSGFDFNVSSKCLNIIVCALADMGGKIYSMDLEFPKEKYTTPNLKPEEMKIDPGYVNKMLGVELKGSKLKKLLERMGYGYKNKKALIPAYRVDLLHQIDLIEDIAIAYGYENFEEEIPKVATIGEESRIGKFIRNIANLLVGLELLETNTYHLMSKKELNENMRIDWPPIELGNAPADYNCLRNWMVPSLMKVLSENRHHDYPQKIFEVGTVFKKDTKEETNVREFKRLAVLASHTKADYTGAKQILDYLMKGLDLEYEIRETEHDSFIPGRAGRVSIDGVDVAYIGELHPGVLERWGLDMPVCGFELNITEVFGIVEKKK